MANEIKLKIKVGDDGSLKIVAKEADKAAKSTDRLAGSTDRLNKKRSGFQKVEKGIGQAGLSTAKGFSKQAGAITGGLVPAYAVLAANIFAITAAFNALKNAAQVEVLEQGFGTLGNAAGRTADLMASKLKDVTGGAISTEQALRSAAAGFSAGFSIQEMEGLAEIARGASVALGRDLGDALDRLIRGTAKLEPEILDELGIFVRLDDAVADYAASLGKTVGEITEAERRQAFLNAALEQGTKKFQLVTDSTDVNVFNQVGATFKELSESFLQIINIGIVPFMKFLSTNMIVLTGAVLAFSLTVIKMMIPALAEMGMMARQRADDMRELVPTLREATKEAVSMQTAMLKGSKTKIGGKGSAFGDLFGKAKKGKASEKELKKLETMYNRSIAQRIAANKKLRGAEKKAHKARTDEMKKERSAIIGIRNEILKTGQAKQTVELYENLADAQDSVSVAMTKLEGGMLGVKDSLLVASTGVAGYSKEVYNAVLQNEALTKPGMWGKFGNRIMMAFGIATTAARLFGVVLLTFMPHVSALLVVIGLLYAGFKALTSGSKQLKGPMGDLDKILETMPEKFEQLNTYLEKSVNLMNASSDANERAVHQGNQLEAKFKVLNGIVAESAGAFKELSGEVEGMDFGHFEAWGLALETGFHNAIKNTLESWRELKEEFPRVTSIFQSAGAVIGGIANGIAEKTKEIVDSAKPDDKQTAINLLESEMRDLFDTLSSQEGVEGIDLERIFGKGVTSSQAFVDTLAELTKEWHKANPGATAYEQKMARLRLTMENAKNSSASLILRTTGLGEKMQETGKKINTSIMKLRKATEFEELATGLSSLQTAMAEVQGEGATAFTDEETSAIWAAQFENMGGDLAKFGIKLEDVRKQGPKAFDELKTAIDAVVEAEQTMARDTAKLQSELKKLDIAESTFKVQRATKQQLATFARIGKYATTAAQDIANAKADAIRLTALEDEKDKKKKALIDLEFKLQEAKIRTAMVGLKEDSAKYKALEAELTILKQIREEKKGVITDETAANKEKIKGDKISKLLTAPDKVQSAVSGAEGTQGKIDAFAEQGGFSSLNTFSNLSDEDKGKMDAGEQASAKLGETKAKLGMLKTLTSDMVEGLKALGPEGEVVAAVAQGAFVIGDAWLGAQQKIADGAKGAAKASAILGAVAQTMQQISAVMAAASQAKIAGIDKEIEAEKKRDGKSKESLAKIKQLEKKKEAAKRKAFEQQKKMQMASVIVSTAAAAAGAYAMPPTPGAPWNIALAAMMVGLGMAQLAIIAGTSYQGGGSSAQSAGPSSISVGERGKSSDLATSKSSRGELAYFRGSQGVGGAENFRGAFYGKKHRAMGGNTGYVVGEQGPELFMPDRPGTIVPADDTAEMTGGASNVTFNISAVDATGVEEVLTKQQGHIISMLRSAANSYGEEFFEEIDDKVLTPHQGFVSRY